MPRKSASTQLQEYVQKKQLMRDRAESLKQQRKHAPEAPRPKYMRGRFGNGEEKESRQGGEEQQHSHRFSSTEDRKLRADPARFEGLTNGGGERKIRDSFKRKTSVRQAEWDNGSQISDDFQMPDINNRHAKTMSNSSNNSNTGGGNNHHHRKFSTTIDSHTLTPKRNNVRASLTPPTNSQDFQKLSKKIEHIESEVSCLRRDVKSMFQNITDQLNILVNKNVSSTQNNNIQQKQQQQQQQINNNPGNNQRLKKKRVEKENLVKPSFADPFWHDDDSENDEDLIEQEIGTLPSSKKNDNGFVGQMKNLRERKHKSKEESASENIDGFREHTNNEKYNAEEYSEEHREDYREQQGSSKKRKKKSSPRPATSHFKPIYDDDNQISPERDEFHSNYDSGYQKYGNVDNEDYGMGEDYSHGKENFKQRDVEKKKKKEKKYSYVAKGAGDYLAQFDIDEDEMLGANAIEEREQCPDCGRKFNLSSFDKHVKHCRKVFKKKRKKFDITQQRVATQGDGKEISLSNNSSDKKWGKTKSFRKERPIKVKKKSWKSQSNNLRDAMRNARIYTEAEKRGIPISSLPAMTVTPDTRTPCPHCGRKFNEEVANRHIPKCKNIINKPKTLRRKR